MLSIGKGLLFVDNLETVDDARIIDFMDDLPVGTRAIVTSGVRELEFQSFRSNYRP